MTIPTKQEWADYEVFIRTHKSVFRRIAYRTAGEHDANDVEHEALEMALRLRDKRGIEMNFTNPDFQAMLLRYLHQHLVAYADTKVRYGVRLDHSNGDDEDAPHPLANILASDGGRNPLAVLIDREASQSIDLQAANHFSLVAAYVRLLEAFNYRMTTVADHLLITVRETHVHLRYAGVLARHQEPLRMPLPSKTFVPGPWRKFRLMRIQEQLTLDLGEQEVLNLHPV